MRIRRLDRGVTAPYVGLASAVVLVSLLFAYSWLQVRHEREASSTTTDRPSTSLSPKIPTVLFIGDSYTQGVGASSLDNAFISIISAIENWRPVNGGYGGTGYIATAGRAECGLAVCPDYRGALQRTRNDDPDIVLISGGRNDISFAIPQFASAVTRTLDEAKAEFPRAKIYLTSPIWDSRQEPAFISRARSVTRSAAEAAGVTYLDIGEPLRGHADWIAPDGIHPNNDGHAAIARAIAASIANRL